jgi:chemotaxis protein CheX
MDGVSMSGIDAQFLNPFLNGTLEALRVTCNLEVNPGQPYVKKNQPQPVFELAAILGISSATFSGSLSLLFSHDVYLKVVSGWLSEEILELNDDHYSGVTELLNIIFGSAKVAWNEQGRNIVKAIPTLVRGNPITTSNPASGLVLVVPFITKYGEFHVEVCSQAA